MNRLPSELQRLYLPGASAPAGRVRALVMELARPASWPVLSTVWQGVQRELELPAPAIAVSGRDGLQLWFSLAEPVDTARAHAFLAGLQSRFLPDVDPDRLRLMLPDGPARQVPALQEQTGNWSAFVAPDLAPIFDETPWLDIPPGDEGQAALLRGLDSIAPAAFDAAMRRLTAAPAPVHVAVAGPPETAVATPSTDAERFLHRVMADESVALALRVDAAKALLAHASGRGTPPPA